jgi:zinc protease
MPRLPLVTLLGTVATGSERETLAEAGIAHLSALALGEGTTSRDGDALNLAFESLGGELHTYAGWSRTEVGVTTTTPSLPHALALLAEVMRAPAFPERGVARLRDERIAELIQQQTEPRALADEHFTELVLQHWGRYALPVGGTRETVQGLTREKLTQWHASHGRTQPALIVVGDISLELIGGMVADAFDDWDIQTHRSDAVIPHDASSGRPAVLLVNKKEAPQTELRIGHASVGRVNPDYYAMTVMNAVLGGLFNSRINLNLRERHGYTYGAFSGFEWRRAASLFTVSTAVNRDNTASAMKEVLLEIDRMRQEPVTEQERSLAVDYLCGVFPLRFETTAAIADAIASRDAMTLPADYYSSYRDHVRRVTREDIHRCAQQYLHPEAIQIVAVGDASSIRPSLDLMNVAAVTEREAIGAEDHAE